jgi:hypothetical protein
MAASSNRESQERKKWVEAVAALLMALASQLDFSARWIHDFDVSKRFAAMGSISA